MSKRIFLVSLILALSVLMVQVEGVFASPVSQAFPPIAGIVQSISIDTDPSTGITTVLVDVMDSNQVLQTVRIGEKTAEKLGLVMPDGDGKSVINDSALGQTIEIKLTTIIPDQEEDRNPVGNALEAFFSDVQGVNYDLIMQTHKEGVGFGVIAQALWLTKELKGDSSVFNALLLAKQTGDYTNFAFDEGGITVIPKNWSDLKKAIMADKKMGNLGLVISNKGGNGSDQDKDKNNNKDKDKNTNGHGSGSGSPNGNGNGNK